MSLESMSPECKHQVPTCALILTLVGIAFLCTSCQDDSRAALFPRISYMVLDPTNERVAALIKEEFGRGNYIVVVDIIKGVTIAETRRLGMESNLHEIPVSWLPGGKKLLCLRLFFEESECLKSVPFLMDIQHGTKSDIELTDNVSVDSLYLISANSLLGYVQPLEGAEGLQRGLYLMEHSGGKWKLHLLLSDEEAASWRVLYVTCADDTYHIIAEKRKEAAGKMLGTTFWTLSVKNKEVVESKQIGKNFVVTYGVAVSADAGWLAVVERKELGPRQLHLLPVALKGEEALAMDAPGDNHLVSFSPDGSRLLSWDFSQIRGTDQSFREKPADFIMLDMETKQVKRIPGRVKLPNSVEWLSTDELLIGAAGGSIWILDVNTGKRRKAWELLM